jgi:putative ABC transport system ATP-binding protein
MEIVLEFQNVRKEYTSGLSDVIAPLDGVSLSLNRGERVILLGKSGSGKTTLLNIAGGVDKPTSGKTLFNGADLHELSSWALADYRRTQVGFIFQSFNLFPTLTVGENLMLPLNFLGNYDDSIGRNMLEQVGLKNKWGRFPEELSGGEQQRVAIARALIKKPSIILADEPTGNLDHETGDDILKLIDRTCNQANAAMIMATHSMETLWLAQRKYKLISGGLEQIENNTAP